MNEPGWSSSVRIFDTSNDLKKSVDRHTRSIEYGALLPFVVTSIFETRQGDDMVARPLVGRINGKTRAIK